MTNDIVITIRTNCEIKRKLDEYALRDNRNLNN